MELLTLITIGIGLSMDTFSVSLAIGTINLSNKKQWIISLVVGIMHFIMPLIGLLLGNRIFQILHVKADFFIALILFLIAFEMIRSTFKRNEELFNLNILGIIAIGFSVSFDSFSAGLGLNYITHDYFFAAIIFSVLSFSFTYLGLSIGKYTKKRFGTYSNIIGAVLLIIVGIFCLL